MRIEREIPQEDSPLPLLFVFFYLFGVLSRKLNEKYPKVAIHLENISHTTNHLLFIDDLKLLAKDGETLSLLTNKVKTSFRQYD